MDDPVAVRCVLFWHYCGFGYLAGESSEEFLSDVAKMVREETTGQKKRCALQVNDPAVEQFFLQQKGIKRWEQYRFTYSKERRKEFRYELPEGYELMELDESHLSRLQGNIIPSFS